MAEWIYRPIFECVYLLIHNRHSGNIPADTADLERNSKHRVNANSEHCRVCHFSASGCWMFVDFIFDTKAAFGCLANQPRLIGGSPLGPIAKLRNPSNCCCAPANVPNEEMEKCSNNATRNSAIADPRKLPLVTPKQNRSWKTP